MISPSGCLVNIKSSVVSSSLIVQSPVSPFELNFNSFCIIKSNRCSFVNPAKPCFVAAYAGDHCPPRYENKEHCRSYHKHYMRKWRKKHDISIKK